MMAQEVHAQIEDVVSGILIRQSRCGGVLRLMMWRGSCNKFHRI
ncbi:hypothetical protein [Methylobacterium sp. B4]|nr:hypothetical protein [Methylobacterium sp. B4]PXW51832.1 hypothetical protein BY998_13231 [Methylobacterium sp. B4]